MNPHFSRGLSHLLLFRLLAFSLLCFTHTTTTTTFTDKKTSLIPISLSSSHDTVNIGRILPATVWVILFDQPGINAPSIASATGFFISNHHVLTAYHFIEPYLFKASFSIKIISNSRNNQNRRHYQVTGIKRPSTHPFHAILEIGEVHPHFLPIAANDAIHDGSEAWVISNTPQLQGLYNKGIVSLVFEGTEYNNLFYLSVPTWLGASGSPVFSMSGVIGTIEYIPIQTPGYAAVARTDGLDDSWDDHVSFTPIKCLESRDQQESNFKWFIDILNHSIQWILFIPLFAIGFIWKLVI